MLVDDKLAKEKLALVVVDHLQGLPVGHRVRISELIRNTDLTDCQQTDSELVKDLRYALQCCEDHGLHIGELKRAIRHIEYLEKAKSDE